jgi:hypothetical protein
VHDVNDPTKDTYQLVGDSWNHYSGGGSGAYDSAHNIYLRSSAVGLTYWDLDFAGPNNRNVNFWPSDPTGQFTKSHNWGVEYDPVRERFVLWKGQRSVWYLEPVEQTSGFTWNLEAAPVSGIAAPTLATNANGAVEFTGVFGKWDYVASHDIFLGVVNHYTGDVWAYKPDGWTPA